MIADNLDVSLTGYRPLKECLKLFHLNIKMIRYNINIQTKGYTLKDRLNVVHLYVSVLEIHV